MGTYLCNIPSDYHVCSEFLRCRQTAAIISNITGKAFVFDKRLNEYSPEIQESFESFQNRVQAFFNDLQTKPYHNILICAHGSVIAAIKNLILADNFEESQLNDFPKTGMLLTIKNKKVEEVDFN